MSSNWRGSDGQNLNKIESNLYSLSSKDKMIDYCSQYSGRNHQSNGLCCLPINKVSNLGK
jgi:hypothetical protein